MDSRKATSDSVSLLEAMHEAWNSPKRHLMVVGDGGTGKSYLFMDAFCRLAGDEDEEIIPLYFDLTKMGGSIRDRIITDYCGSLDDTNEEDLTSVINGKLKSVFTSKRPDKPECVFFIDGLNEVESSKYLGEIITEFLNDYDGYDGIQIVIAVRNPFWQLEDKFGEWHVLELEDEQIKAALRKAGQDAETIPSGIMQLLHRPLFLFMYRKQWTEKALTKQESAISTAGEFFDAHYDRLIKKTKASQDLNQRAEFALRYLFPAITMSGKLPREFDYRAFNLAFRRMRPHTLDQRAFSTKNTFENDPAEMIKLLVNMGVLQEVQKRNKRYRFRHAFHYEYLRAKFICNEMCDAVENRTDCALPPVDGSDALAELSVRMPFETLRWVGEILKEHVHSGEDSVVEKYMRYCGGVALGNCVEILKISRNNKIQVTFDGLDLSNTRLSGVDLLESSFRGATIQTHCFLPVVFDRQADESRTFDDRWRIEPLISPDGQYIVSSNEGKLQLLFLKDYLPYVTALDNIKCPHFTRDNSFVFCGITNGITAFSHNESGWHFRRLYPDPKELSTQKNVHQYVDFILNIVDICLYDNYLVVLAKDELKIIDVDTQEIIVSSSDRKLLDNQYAALSKGRSKYLNLALISKTGSLTVAEIDVKNKQMIPETCERIELKTRLIDISRIEFEGDYLLLEMTDEEAFISSDNSGADIWLLDLPERSIRKIYGNHDVCCGTACFDAGTNGLSFITGQKPDQKTGREGNTSYYFRKCDLHGNEVLSELCHTRYVPISSNGETCIVRESEYGNLAIYSLRQRQIQFDITDPDYSFDSENTDIFASGRKIAVLFRTDFAFPYVFEAVKTFDLENGSISYTDLKQVQFYKGGDEGIVFQATNDDLLYLFGQLGLMNGQVMERKHTLIPTNGEMWNGMWDDTLSAECQEKMALEKAFGTEQQFSGKPLNDGREIDWAVREDYVIYNEKLPDPEIPFHISIYPLSCPCSENGRAVYANGKELTVFDYRTGDIKAKITPLLGRVDGCNFQGAIMDDDLKKILKQNGAKKVD